MTDGDWVESKDQDPSGSVRLIQLADIGDGHFVDRSTRYMNPRTVDRLGCTLLKPGDLLVARMPEPLGRACLFPDVGQPAVTVVDIMIWRADPVEAGADPRWLMYAINSPEVRQRIHAQSGGSTRVRISGGKLKRLEIPVPPLAEQERISEKVGQLLAGTRRAQSELAPIPALIARYKSALMRKAFSGELTADLRRDGSSVDGLPAEWELRALGDISEIQGGIQVGKRRTREQALVEVPYLRVANVQRGWLALNDVRTIQVTPAERDRLLLRKGDILMNEGGDRDKLGRGWVWDEQIPQCIHQNHVFRIRMRPGIVPPEFVSHFANEHGQRYFFDEGTQTTNLASISKRKVAALPVPVPPLDEALEIVRRLEAALAWLDGVSADHGRATEFLAPLEAAILSKALRGGLVPQDDTDEPAAVRLNRIKTKTEGRPVEGRARSSRATRLGEAEVKVDKTVEQVLTEASDWISAQAALQLCGHGDNARTEDIEQFYAQLRELDLMGKLEVKTVTDGDGNKIEDQLRLKAA
ncbi:restriction endonuclease subunit S [Phenylobacterium terrae]|uniref:Restriction endonuclease subunit S n=1 Tax=Phenylobacterium terrae TaxID=2665495 RepID=A0ABW4MX64_9CAUL